MSSPAEPAPPRSRADWIDWLRGLAVVFMVQYHAYDAWVGVASRQGASWAWIAHVGGFAAPLFLFTAGLLVGLRDVAPRALLRRGLEVIAYGYLFRLAMIALANFRTFAPLPKIDILQQIGFSLVLAAPLCLTKRRALFASLALLALLLLVAPVSALPPAPAWARPITDFVTGVRPMSPFPALPWAAYALGGVLYGALVRGRTGPALDARVFSVVVAGCTIGALGRWAIHPWVVDRFGACDPNHCLDGAVRVLYRLGGCVAFAGLAHAATRRGWAGWRAWLLMGKRSLLIYAVHVPFVYGTTSRAWMGKHVSVAAASLAVLALLGAMIALAVLRERWPARRAAAPGRDAPS
jgi:uncharacterized membrane protein